MQNLSTTQEERRLQEARNLGVDRFLGASLNVRLEQRYTQVRSPS